MKDLNDYFDKAARQKEIVPLSQIEEILSLKQHHAQSESHDSFYTTWKRKQPGVATITTFTILLLAFIAFLFLQEKKQTDQEVFIPQAQRRLMHLVKNISDRPQNNGIRISQFGTDAKADATGIPIHLRSKFELSQDQLKLLGITFYDEYIQYEGNVKGSGYVAFRIPRTGVEPPSKFSFLEVSGQHRSGVKVYEFYPWFMTDEAGYQGFRYRFRDEPALKTTSSFFLNAIDQLIPIQINRPGFEKVTFWFSQTPELMNILESAAMISKKTEIPGEATADEITRTSQIEIFPTITKGDVKVIVNVLRKQKLEITLLNSSGEVLQVPVRGQPQEPGEHNFTIDLSALRKGLYFVRIKSDPGLITIHRLFRE